MKTRLLEAIVISTRPYGESDRLVTCFSKEQGKNTAIAKGVRKPTSRKRGALEVFNVVRLQVTDSSGLGIITEVQLVSSHNELRTDLKKMAVAYFFCEVVQKITPDHGPNVELYSFFEAALSSLEVTTNIRRLKDTFTWNILEISGFTPPNDSKANPQKILEEVLERDLSSVRVGKLLQ